MKPTVWIVVAALVLSPFAMISFGILMKLGIETSLERYGAVATVVLIALIFPFLVAIGFLLDMRQGQKPDIR